MKGAGKTQPNHSEAAVTLPPFTSSYGQTPIDMDAREYLQPEYSHLETNADLDRAESLNITDAMSWVLGQEWTTEELLESATLRGIHRKMFGNVWTWAGKLRTREVNIGNCPADQVAVRLEQILGNFTYQASTGRPAADLCIEYHQALTQVHPFINGNGRHARLTTELLATSMGLDPETITWGSAFEDAEERRLAYLESLRSADRGEFTRLRAFIFG